MVAPGPVPALPDAARFTPYAVTNSAGPFACGFAIYGDSSDYTAWVSVTLDGVARTDWTLDSPSGPLIGLARPITDARITFTNAVTGALVITSAQRPRRLAQNAENRGVTARDFNQTYTAIIAMLREAWDMRGRMLLAPPGESIGILPTIAGRALQMLGFDAAGNPIAAQPSSALVSSAMQDVTAAASHAAALALLGGAPASAIIPIGGEMDWPGLSVPALWLPSDGTTRLRASFPELFNVLAPVIVCGVISGDINVHAIASTDGYGVGWPVEGAGFAPGTTIAAIGVSFVTLSVPAIGNDSQMRVFPHGNGDGVTSFNLPNGSGKTYAGLDTAGTTLTVGTVLGKAVGIEKHTLLPNELPAHAHSITDMAHGHPLVNAGNVSTGGPNGAGAGITGGPNLPITVTPAFTGITATNVNITLNTPVSVVQPTSIRRKIIYAGH